MDTAMGYLYFIPVMNLETTVLSCRVWLREAEVCSGRQRWSWLRILLETLTVLSDTTLWVGTSFSPRSLFRRLKGQQLKKTSYREALLFCTLTHTQLRQPGYPTLPSSCPSPSSTLQCPLRLQCLPGCQQTWDTLCSAQRLWEDGAGGD